MERCSKKCSYRAGTMLISTVPVFEYHALQNVRDGLLSVALESRFVIPLL
jgi:hypothetical protein